MRTIPISVFLVFSTYHLCIFLIYQIIAPFHMQRVYSSDIHSTCSFADIMYTYTYTHTYMYMYIYISVYMYVHIYIYRYIYRYHVRTAQISCAYYSHIIFFPMSRIMRVFKSCVCVSHIKFSFSFSHIVNRFASSCILFPPPPGTLTASPQTTFSSYQFFFLSTYHAYIFLYRLLTPPHDFHSFSPNDIFWGAICDRRIVEFVAQVRVCMHVCKMIF